MSAEAFIDSNVLVYLFDKSAPAKRGRAESLVEDAMSVGSACISHQVVQECLNVAIRKFAASPEQANQFLSDVLLPLWKINPTSALFAEALGLRARFRFGFYDSLIVAAALQANCTTLYSEDLQHNQRIEQLTIVNPFV